MAAGSPEVRRGAAPGFSEVWGVWIAIAATTIAVFATYARLDPGELYNVSEEGAELGFGRALVFLNFPVALIAVALAFVAAAILPSRVAKVGALLVVASTSLLPFVVDQSDLDARPANAIPAAGVAVALVLTVAAARRRGRPALVRLPGDGVRVVLAAFLLVLAVPWFFAELGFYAPDPILADEPSPGEPLAAVHLGHHHGTDGVLLALAALALSRVTPRLPGRRLPAALSAYVALMLVYGLANAVQDAWFEQVVKRGSTSLEIPSVLLPKPSVAWAVLVLVTALVEILWFRRERRAGRADGAEAGRRTTSERPMAA